MRDLSLELALDHAKVRVLNEQTPSEVREGIQKVVEAPTLLQNSPPGYSSHTPPPLQITAPLPTTAISNPLSSAGPGSSQKRKRCGDC